VNGVHDMGGTHGHGAVVIEPDEPVFHEPWEGRVYGIMRGMRAAGLFNLDQFRHARERQSPTDYLRSTYYQSWLSALELIARETGAIVPVETLAEQRPEPAFKAGDSVMTRNINPLGHTRLPRYARARRGIVDSVHGPYKLPDTNAHHQGLDWEPVYTVRFDARELWGDGAEPRTTIRIDLSQSYLEGAP